MRRFLYGTRWGRLLLTLPRAWFALRLCLQPVWAIAPWLLRSREYTNFSYDLTPCSRRALAHGIAAASGLPARTVHSYIDEVLQDTELQRLYAEQVRRSSRRWSLDEALRPGRRLAYYVAVRALRPRFVVEAGVDKGQGALLMLRALMRNAQEGHPGRYLGLEWNPDQRADLLPPGWLAAHGEMRWGDSTALLPTVQAPIDLFIHDTSPLSAHVQAQWQALGPQLAPQCMVLSPWTTEDFFTAAENLGCRALVLHDEPQEHWHPGSRLFLAYRR